MYDTICNSQSYKYKKMIRKYSDVLHVNKNLFWRRDVKLFLRKHVN